MDTPSVFPGWPTLLGSVTAGTFARALCHPIDTCKARLQDLSGGKTVFRNTAHVVRTTIAEEGVRGLYRGVGAAIVGCRTMHCCQENRAPLEHD